MTADSLLTNLTNLYNWCANNRPSDFHEYDGRDFLTLNISSFAKKHNLTETEVEVSLAQLKESNKIDLIKDNYRLMFSLDIPEPAKPVLECKPSAGLIGDTVSYEGRPLYERYLLWCTGITKEWDYGVKPDIKAERFGNSIRRYNEYRKDHPVPDPVRRGVTGAIVSGVVPDTYAPSLVLTPDEHKKGEAMFGTRHRYSYDSVADCSDPF